MGEVSFFSSFTSEVLVHRRACLYTYRGNLSKFTVPVAREREIWEVWEVWEVWETRETCGFDIWSLSGNQMRPEGSPKGKHLGLHYAEQQRISIKEREG